MTAHTTGFILSKFDRSIQQESNIAFSRDKNELLPIQEKLESEHESVLARFKLTQKDRDDYMLRFDNECPFRMNETPTPNYYDKLKEWVTNNPIPENLKEFVVFWEIENEGHYYYELTFKDDSDYDFVYSIYEF